ncbi:hypothetical protein LSAT2_025972 [Lamellibrachia satsuma]|nr:hypothetical protein LSAT2_025972 [Lamellibrachia satsuma]
MMAPEEMRRGWFISLLNFYARQAGIAEGMPLVIGFAFLMTLNRLITFYAMLSIAAAIFVTIAALVLLGWQLNVLESVTILATVGLSIDFTLHCCMAYRLLPDLDGQMRVACGMARMSSPVAVAALTTFLAGAAPSSWLSWPYIRVLTHYPYVVLALVSILAATCLVVTFTIGTLPDFTDPRLGFEVRGTEISKRVRSHADLFEATIHTQSTKRSADRVGHTVSAKIHQRHLATNASYNVDDVDSSDYSAVNDSYSATDAFFCDRPRKAYARVVYVDIDGGNLFTVRRIKAMCRLEDDVLRRHQSFRDACVETTVSRQCCRSWSLGNYISRLTNRTSCYHIRHRDVAYVENLLTTCVTYYRSLSLLADCYDAEANGGRYRQCNSIPAPCKRYNAVYDILHYLADVDFMADGDDGINRKLSYSMSFLPVAAGTGAVPLYDSLDGTTLSGTQVKVVAVDFGVKQELFDKYLQDDVLWFGVALLAIMLAMWIYTTSLFLTIMAVISLFLSLEISYFVYTLVFNIRFFPFMNLLVLVILIGVGADNVFIYCKTWTLAKQEKNVGTLEKIVSDTLKHATLSIFVTSLTTAAAFYASYVSHITALACFALFAGTTVIVNFFIVITWFPASLVVYEKWLSDCCLCYGTEFYGSKRGSAYYARALPYTVYERACVCWRAVFEKLLPCAVLRLRVVWLLSLAAVALGAIVVVFYSPRLRLPTSDDFQLFSHDHLFEVYDLRMKRHFWFERAVGNSVVTMPMTIVWGVQPVDAGDKLDPFSKSSVVYDETFNLATPRAQRWLLRFCRALRTTDFYQREPGLQLTNCFIEHFKLFMESDCDATASVEQRSCCGFDTFPFSEDEFNRCVRVYAPILAHSRRIYHSNPNAGPRFSKDTGKLVALVVEFNSKEPYSLSYEKIAAFYNYMDSWVSERMLTAPEEMRRGWFVSLLDFYALQVSIAEGTPLAIGIAIAIATVVAFLTTLNLLITFYAMLSIAAAIFVTIAALVLLGWQLNVLESVTISAAVGLSIDFTLHYGMAYRLSPDLDRQMRVACGTARMGSPVAVAALTTFLAGALMMPSTILAYRQLGTFLMVVMAVSWTYATFFFQSLLRCFGPEGGFGQFHWPTCGVCDGSDSRWRRHVDKTVYTMSESTLSSSSVTHANNSSETHELEHLTDDSCRQQHRLGSKTVQHHKHSAESLDASSTQPTPPSCTSLHVDDDTSNRCADRESCARLLESNGSCEQAGSLTNNPNVWLQRHEHM